MTQITVLKVAREKAANKNYVVTNLSYKTSDGKVKGLKIFPFKDQAEVAAAFVDAVEGDVYDVTFRKNEKDFWELAPTPVRTGARVEKAVSAGAASVGSTAPAVRGNWETSEERAARQVMIARQSSLQRTLEFFELTGHKKPDLDDVLKVTEVLVNYVQNGLPQQTGEIQ